MNGLYVNVDPVILIKGNAKEVLEILCAILVYAVVDQALPEREYFLDRMF